MYCKVCQACFISFWSFSVDVRRIHHRDYASLSLSSAQSCQLCMDLMELIQDPSEPQPEPLTVWKWIPMMENEQRSTWNEQRSLVYIYLLTKWLPGREVIEYSFPYASALITENCPLTSACNDAYDGKVTEAAYGHAVAVDTGSQQTWSHVLGWLKDCINLHGADCNSTMDANWVPTRLLHVEKDGNIRLQTYFSGVSVRYTTLSHCWGANDSQLKLTPDNIGSLQRNIDIDSLSKTFQDAVEITRRLEVDFLWIDSLCIIQGDKQDWQREASRMGKVYSNGMVNISAHSDDPDQGCFRVRDPSRVQLISFDGHCPQEPSKRRAMYPYFFWQRNVDSSPVNRRGWV
jgi:hypothetical protein